METQKRGSGTRSTEDELDLDMTGLSIVPAFGVLAEEDTAVHPTTQRRD